MKRVYKQIIIAMLCAACIAGIVGGWMISTQQESLGESVEVLSKYGSRGEEVRKIQERLKKWGYYTGNVDGIYGSQTKAAVERFQRKNGLSVDGIAGPQTLAAIGISSSLSYGSQGDDVRKVQEKLKQWGYYTGSVDGIYGSQTKVAVEGFQRKNGLSVDGIAGPQTLAAIGVSSGSSSTPDRSNDVKLLARIISAEARGEPYTGQVAIGAVVLNRVKHPSFPNTISGVIYQNGAFTAVTDGNFDRPVVESAYRAAEDALNGWDPTGGSVYYYNPAKTTNKWMLSLPITTTIGNHVFSRGK